MERLFTRDSLKRLLACLAGGFVLALMIGNQEGVQNDYSYAFRQAVFSPRIIIFLAIGVGVFFAISFWPLLRPYLGRPGVVPLAFGLATIIAADFLLKWFDPEGDGKLSTVAKAVGDTSGISSLAKAYFGWLWWVGLLIVVAGVGTAIVLHNLPLAWAAAAVSVVIAVLSVTSHNAVVNFAKQTDHSTGAYIAALGYLVVAVAGVTVAMSHTEIATTRATIDRLLDWRPGLPLIGAGVVVGLLGLGYVTWYSPGSSNTNLSETATLFKNAGLPSLASQYLSWLGWLLFAATMVAAGAGAYLRNKLLAAGAVVIGLVALFLTLWTMYHFTKLGAEYGKDSATGPWQNLGAGGWMVCLALALAVGGALVAATYRIGGRVASSATPVAAATSESATDPATGQPRFGKQLFGSSPTMAFVLFAAIAVALFYPPTATTYWQSVLVTEIGVYVLLAVGLNVVVGWAGLLDLGFIAFYAIGSYTTAYLVGSLPRKPPSWLHLSPLWAIPFAIVICLIAGVLLGAPTLRLRGDYLAIVTLGFGEIIRLIAVNNPGSITNGPRGVQPQVPHPVVDLGFHRFVWALNPLQYWYLLLILLVIVVVLFNRLENSRIGRAWAAIREDEVAAQATGVNTVRIKLLAFAIGASTSGLAGVFFASQVGYFNPDNFVLNNSILVVAYVVFGGMGSLPGAMAGAAVLTWLPEFLKDQVPAVDRQMWIGAIVLAMMIFRPQGLIPAKRRKTELHGLDMSPSSEVRAVPAGEGL
jgi:ABC-type branched-subunit amino acid transport system permease subunit